MVDVRAAARALAAEARARAAEGEASRRMPPDLAASFARAGLFRLCVPRSLGGLEVEPDVLIDVIETVAEADGSAGWCLMIGATSGLVSGWLPEATAAEIYGRDPEVVTGGVFAPRGRAVAVDGGYVVTGRWPFASGCQHCGWLMGGAVVVDGGAPRMGPDGVPDVTLALFPAADARIHDTWAASGLRGTGSHDIEVRELFVPAARAVSLITGRPHHPGRLYAFPPFGLLALGIAAVSLGIARAALAEVTSLATVKVPTLARQPLGTRAAVQADVARGTALVRSAGAYLRDAAMEAWEATRTDPPASTGSPRSDGISVPLRADLRLAATHAVKSAARAVDLAYEAGGGSALYDSSPLQRCFRDAHAATQHMMVGPATLELTGRVLLGLAADTSML